MSVCRRVVAVLALCVGIVVGVVSPSDAAVTPAPYPTDGGAAAAWSCSDVPGPEPTDPPAGRDCVVTAWGADPAPAPVELAPGEAVSGTVAIDGSQWVQLVFGLGVLVMLASASFVIGQSRPPTFGAPSILGRRR